MNELEKVVNVSQKLGITYEDAKKYLDAHNWDEAEVIAFVESERKEEEESKRRAEEAAKIAMEAARQAVADEQIKNSNEDTVEEGTIFTGKVEGNQKEENKTMNGFKNVCKKIWQVAKNILKKSIQIQFVITNKGEKIVSLPVLVLVAALIVAFPLTVIGLIIGLFCECKYSFSGFDTVKVDINDVCEKASRACDSVKKEFTKAES